MSDHNIPTIHGLAAFAYENGVITVNEFREKFLGLDKLDNADGELTSKLYAQKQAKAIADSRPPIPRR